MANSLNPPCNLKMVSGGQTGADRAALDFALRHGLEHAAWCPKGKVAAHTLPAQGAGPRKGRQDALVRNLVTALAALLSANNLLASPFCSDSAATRAYFHAFCDYVAANKTNVPVIFTGGYYMRDLVAGYKIFGDKRYLATAVAYADGLLEKQSPRGYWQSGYSRLYLADTASALGLFIVLCEHVGRAHQQTFLAAVQRYVDAIERDGLIRPSGALDVGFLLDSNRVPTRPYGQDYSTSSALTGGEVFTWMYHMTGQDKYRQIAYNSQKWILSTMREDGMIPYNYPGGRSDLRIKGDARNDFMLWTNSAYVNSAYIGEGLLSFDLYCGKPAWRKEIRQRIKPHIDWLLRTQNPDGTWSVQGNWDQKRSPGIINFLIWYYDHVQKDPRIPAAVRKFNAFILVPANGKAFGMLNEGAVPGPKDQTAYDCVTGLTGRALADILKPGVDAQW